MKRILHYVFGVPLVWLIFNDGSKNLRILRLDEETQDIFVYWSFCIGRIKLLPDGKLSRFASIASWEPYGAPKCTCCKVHKNK